MPYRNAKIYNDGSHYIAIPQTNNPTKRKKSPTKTVCTGTELQTKENKTGETATEILTPKERFEKIYRENNGKRKADKIEILTEEQTREFVQRNIERLQRNKIVRKTRLARKINLNEWNFFCTFTEYSLSPKTVCRENWNSAAITVSANTNGRSLCKIHTLTINSDETTSTN